MTTFNSNSRLTFYFVMLLLLGKSFGDEIHVFDDQLAAEAAEFAPAFEPPAVERSVPSDAGSWGPVIPWTPHIPVTAVNLPDGRLLTWAADARTTFPNRNEFTYAAVWDPATGIFTEINNTRHNMICPGVVMLPDGRVLATGGGSTTSLVSVFDYRTNQWSGIQSMNDPRWYNTSVALADGTVFAVSGSVGQDTAERWDAATGWRRLTGIDWSMITSQPGYLNIWYPFVLLAPDGNLFHFGPTDAMTWVNPNGSGSLTPSGQTVPGLHYPVEGAWAMYDEGKILVTGGGSTHVSNPPEVQGYSPSTQAAYTVDLNGSNPVVTSIDSMRHARSFANTVILPSGEVMIVGGNSSGYYQNDTGSILTPELWNPLTGTWRTLADMAVPRNYHSVALLLPDGRVWSGGGGLGGNSADHRDAQIFTPPCLFKADGSPATRPGILQAPAQIEIGSSFTVAASPGLAKFALIKMSAQTHSTNTDLRHLSLAFTETTPGTYEITAHSNRNVLTPGFWMLFALNSSGVHSVAKIVQASIEIAPQLANPGDQINEQNTLANLQMEVTAGGENLTFTATGLPGGLEISTAGLISGTVTAAPGEYPTTITGTSSTGSVATVLFKWTVLFPNQGRGQFLREWWLGIPGDTVAELTNSSAYPANPSGRDFPTSFEAPTGWGDNYGQRMRGYVHAPVSGNYRFWIASDDNSQLFVGASSNPASATKIASVSVWTNPRQWTKYPEQKSALITLAAGEKYYIEALMKEGEGGDNLSVAWSLPGTTTPVLISGQYLSPYLVRSPVFTQPLDQNSLTNSIIAFQIRATDPDGDALTYTATGLPPGLMISSSSGVIFGAPMDTGTFPVTVTATDNISPPTSVEFVWNVTDGLTLSSLNGQPQADGTHINFAAVSTGGINPRYVWSFGDGSPDSAASDSPEAAHTFPGPGRYLVTVTATDLTGRTVSTSFNQAIHASLTARKPSVSGSIAYELSAVGNPRLWVVNPDNDSVSVFDAVTRVKLSETQVGAAPRTLAIAPDGSVWVTCSDASTISILSKSTFEVARTLTLPRGTRPFGIAFDTANAWVALEATGHVLRLDASSGAQTASIDVGQDVRHLSISADETRVYVSRFITPPISGEATAAIDTTSQGGEVLVIDTAALAVVRTIILQHSDKPDIPLSARGIPNYLGAPAISPDGLSAWVPSKQDNIKRGTLRSNGQMLTHDSTMRAISSQVNLTQETEVYAARVDFDNAGMPSATCFDPWGIYAFTALESSRSVAVMDVWNQREITRFPVGRAPQGLTISPDGRTLFVHNFMDRSVTVHDVSGIIGGGVGSASIAATLNCVAAEKLTPQVLLGKQHFYDALDSRLAMEGYISCASCHNDGGHDGRVWDFTGFGEGLRNTISLLGHGGSEHGSMHWSGNFDEVQDFENQIRNLAGGIGLMASGTPSAPLGDQNAGRSADLDALASYVASLTGVGASPARSNANTLPASAIAGRAVFNTLDCASCHSGTGFTNSALNVFRDVGTIKSTSGQRLGAALPGLDVPTLRGLFATAPYLHDGSAATLADAVRAHTNIAVTGTDLENLVAYLNNIDDDVRAAPIRLDVSLQNLTQAYDGSPKSVAATTDTLGINVAVSYNGLPAAPISPGAYSVNAVVIDPDYYGTASGTLFISPANNYAAWCHFHFEEEEQLQGLAMENADPDSDNLPNLAEYALGADPNQFTPPLVPAFGPDGLSLVFTYPANLSDISYAAESSTDVRNWTSVPLELLNAGPTNTMRVVLPRNPEEHTPRFLRLRFERN